MELAITRLPVMDPINLSASRREMRFFLVIFDKLVQQVFLKKVHGPSKVDRLEGLYQQTG